MWKKCINEMNDGRNLALPKDSIQQTKGARK